MRHTSTRARGKQALAIALSAFGLLMAAPSPLWALSEIQKDAVPAAAQTQASPPQSTQPPASDDGTPAPDDHGVPPPPPIKGAPGADDQGTGDDQSEPEQVQPANSDTPDVTRPNIDPNAPLPEVLYDLSKLPDPVRKMHDQLREACKSGDIEKLRALLSTGDQGTQLSLGEVDGDPVDFIHQQSGDADGQEILAIMEEILDAGYVHLDAGKPTELYVWPYFFAIPLARLNAPQRVELYRIITAGDYEDMKSVGAYIFYRVGITPQGKWAFFLTGD